MILPMWHGDTLVDGPAAAIDVLDAGLRSGVGVFETLRAEGTATLAAERHLQRLSDGARRIGITIESGRIRDALVRTLAAPRTVDEVAVRITVTAGPVTDEHWPPVPVGRPTLIITLHPAPALPLPSVDAVTVPARRWPADLKSTSYLASVLAQREAVARGADTAVLHDGDELLESAEGNLFVVAGGELRTPPADGRLLPGVTRALVLEAAERLDVRATVAPLLRADALAADALLVTSAVSGIRTVRTLDGVTIGSAGSEDTASALVDALRAALEAQRR